VACLKEICNEDGIMIAHIFQKAGRFYFSGHNASGDPFEGAGLRADREPRPFDAVVDVGRDFVVTPEGQLYVTGPHQFMTWTADELVLAAKKGWFGFKLLEVEAPHRHASG